MNWAKDLRTELCQVIYDRELYPKTLWLDAKPVDHEEFDEEVIQPQIERKVAKDIFVPSYWEREDTD